MMLVSIMRNSRRDMVRIQTPRCTFIAVVREIRLNSRPSAASAKKLHTARKKTRATASLPERVIVSSMGQSLEQMRYPEKLTDFWTKIMREKKGPERDGVSMKIDHAPHASQNLMTLAY